jgi:hypothetical protein
VERSMPRRLHEVVALSDNAGLCVLASDKLRAKGA